MASATPTSLRMSSRPIYSCVRCSDRKVKCDRQNPCAACVKHNVDCIYNHNPSHLARKRHRQAQDYALIDRLKHYEVLLQELGIDPELRGKATPTAEAAPLPQASQLQNPSTSSVESEPSQYINKTQIIHGQGRSKFVDKSVASKFVQPYVYADIPTVAYGREW
jgi:hypothetical protein